MKIKISEDKQTVTLSIPNNLSASEIEKLIADLSKVRASMLPSIPFSQPETEDQNISFQDDPHFAAELQNDGRIRLWFRDYGLGWMIFNIPVSKACTLRDFLIANTPNSTEFNFFSNNLRDRDATQGIG
ncbi:hypothetical protein [Nitrosomonas sp. Nm34]|uniref:hypothetical protein n=1 Tax=Nitrosomonas sp. Nm34 TaxID=1881055 RepID=UPI0008E371BD|nr:hypothetical protein [Nitrosomonas sp. Nm34]SFI74606.1 hypothetical protein SAMN05428978_10328 [Nitrosomonas sp. Nm34]